MKKQILLSIMIIGSFLARAQTKIKDGTIISPITPNANAILELESNNKGFLLPRVQLSATNTPSPLTAHIEGMTVYNTATAGSAPDDVLPGYYFNDGTKWVRIITEKVDLRLVGLNNHITMDAGIGANGISAGSGTNNIGIGQNSLLNNQAGFANVAIGYNSLSANTNGAANVAIGGFGTSPVGPLGSNTTGTSNVAILDALLNNTTGRYNVGIGYGTLASNVIGYENIGIGSYALNHYAPSSALTNRGSIGLGARAFNDLVSGENNIAIGNWAGIAHTAGDNNIFIGKQANSAVSTTASNQLNIGNWVYGDNGKIGIAQPLPHSTLHVKGSVAANVVAVTADYTILEDDYTIISRAATGITLTLPAPATCKGRMYYIINNGSQPVTTSLPFEVSTGNTQTTIPVGGVGISMPNPNFGNKYLLQSDGTTWVLLNLG